MYKTIIFLILLIFVSPSYAALVFSIDNYTTDELSFTISGAFDTDTIGFSPGHLAIKNDWSNNGGSHTEMFATTPLVTHNSIEIGGSTPLFYVQNGTFPWNDDIVFSNTLGVSNPFLAGTTVSGSMTLSGAGAFDPANASTLELLSGFSTPYAEGLGNDWSRLEASAQVAPVPLPASIWFLGAGLVWLTGKRRKQGIVA